MEFDVNLQLIGLSRLKSTPTSYQKEEKKTVVHWKLLPIPIFVFGWISLCYKQKWPRFLNVFIHKCNMNGMPCTKCNQYHRTLIDFVEVYPQTMESQINVRFLWLALICKPLSSNINLEVFSMKWVKLIFTLPTHLGLDSHVWHMPDTYNM